MSQENGNPSYDCIWPQTQILGNILILRNYKTNVRYCIFRRNAVVMRNINNLFDHRRPNIWYFTNTKNYYFSYNHRNNDISLHTLQYIGFLQAESGRKIAYEHYFEQIKDDQRFFQGQKKNSGMNNIEMYCIFSWKCWNNVEFF